MDTSVKARKSTTVSDDIKTDVEIGPHIDRFNDINKEIISPDVDLDKDKTNPNLRNANILSACLMYSFCGVSMVIVNKSLAYSYKDLIAGDLNVFLVVVQSLFSVVAVCTCKRVGLIDYPGFNLTTAIRWVPVNLFFCAMLFSGMASLQHNSIPMVTVFKNITNIIVALGDFFFFGNKPEILTIVAFIIMVLGATAAARHDFAASFVGLWWMLVNCCATSGYILYMNFATKSVNLPKFGMVFYNNMLCTLFLLPVIMINGELNIFLSNPALHTADYYAKNMFAGIVGFFLNFASLNCVATTGPSTYAIIGALNKVPIIFLGYVIFEDKIQKDTWIFILISLCGGFLYSYAKLTSTQ